MMNAAVSGCGASRVENVCWAPPSGLSAEEQLLALDIYTQVGQLDAAKTSVNINAEQLEKLREQVKHALDEAQKAHHKSGFWHSLSKLFGSDLASIATAVAAVAAVVATGGAAAAVLAVVAAAASMAAEHAKELGIPPGVAAGIALVATAAALVSGNGAGFLKVTSALSDAAKTAKTVQVAATVTSAAFKGVGAGTSVAAASYDHDASCAHADAHAARGQQTLVNGDIDEALGQLSDALDRKGWSVSVASDVARADAASRASILGNWRDVA